MYAKLKFEANKKRDKIIEHTNKARPKIQRTNHEYYPRGVIGKTAGSEMRGNKPALMFAVGGIIGFITGIIILYNNQEPNFFTPIFTAAGCGLLFDIVASVNIARRYPVTVLKRLRKKRNVRRNLSSFVRYSFK